LVHLVFIKNLCIEQDVFELRGIARVKAIAFKNLPEIWVFRANWRFTVKFQVAADIAGRYKATHDERLFAVAALSGISR